MHVIVTGACGHLGRAIVRNARRRGYEVTALARRPCEPPASGVRYHEFDLARPTLPLHLPADGVLFHAAAFIPSDHRSLVDAERCFQLNALATATLVELAHGAGVRRVVYLSGTSLYTQTAGTATEDHGLYPSPAAPGYLVSKLAGELFGSAAADRLGTEFIVARISSPYGPDLRQDALIKVFVQAALDGRPLLVRSDQRTDLVYVDDVVDALLGIGGAGRSRVYNLASGEWLSIAEIARTIVRVSRSRSSIDTDAVRHAPSVMPAVDITRARVELGFQPRSLAAGIADLLGAWRA